MSISQASYLDIEKQLQNHRKVSGYSEPTIRKFCKVKYGTDVNISKRIIRIKKVYPGGEHFHLLGRIV